jgi:hypothetical protein
MQIDKSTNTETRHDLYPPFKLPIERGDMTRVASIVGVDHSHVSRWYHGKYKNKPDDHQKLMDALLDIIEEREKKDREHKKRIEKIRSLS